MLIFTLLTSDLEFSEVDKEDSSIRAKHTADMKHLVIKTDKDYAILTVDSAQLPNHSKHKY